MSAWSGKGKDKDKDKAVADPFGALTKAIVTLADSHGNPHVRNKVYDILGVGETTTAEPEAKD